MEVERRLDELLDNITIKESDLSEDFSREVDARIDAFLRPLKAENLPIGITNYDLAVISTYLTGTIGGKSPIDVSNVAHSLGLNIDDAMSSFDRFVALGILEKSGEGTYTMERGIRHELKKRTSEVMISGAAMHYLARNVSPTLFSQIGQWALDHPYKNREVPTDTGGQSPFARRTRK